MAKLQNSARINLVDGLCRKCLNRPDVEPGVPGHTTAQRRLVLYSYEISGLFGYPDDWFDRSRNRQPLYEQGFPRPIRRARWSREAVYAWFERIGAGRPSGT
jgi:hypothetical protein